MRTAAVDIASEILADVVGPLCDAGLTIVGSLNRGMGAGPVDGTAVRVIVEDSTGTVLPAECQTGLFLVTPRFSLESYGKQRLARLDSISVHGRLEFPAGAPARVIAA